jgi:hypothetical protein
MMPLKKQATYADLSEVPEHFVAEMFDGDLYATPRPAMPHAYASSVVMQKLAPFHRSGPGGAPVAARSREAVSRGAEAAGRPVGAARPL